MPASRDLTPDYFFLTKRIMSSVATLSLVASSVASACFKSPAGIMPRLFNAPATKTGAIRIQIWAWPCDALVITGT